MGGNQTIFVSSLVSTGCIRKVPQLTPFECSQETSSLARALLETDLLTLNTTCDGYNLLIVTFFCFVAKKNK